MSVNEFRERNKKFLDAIHESVRNQHDYSPNVADDYDASLMFLHTISWEKVKEEPMWKPKQKPEQ